MNFFHRQYTYYQNAVQNIPHGLLNSTHHLYQPNERASVYAALCIRVMQSPFNIIRPAERTNKQTAWPDRQLFHDIKQYIHRELLTYIRALLRLDVHLLRAVQHDVHVLVEPLQQIGSR